MLWESKQEAEPDAWNHRRHFLSLFLLSLLGFQFSHSFVSILQSYGLQHTRLPHPSPTPGACSNSCPSSWLCWLLGFTCLFSSLMCLPHFYLSPNWLLAVLCAYILSCACAKLLQSSLALCDPEDCSPPGSSVDGVLQATILECVALPSSRGSSQPRDCTSISSVSCIGAWPLVLW